MTDLSDLLVNIFSTFVGFVSGVLFVTEAVNKLFKIENTNARLAMSWLMSFALAALGFVLHIGFFADCGGVDTWQGWVKTLCIGLGGGWCANKMYNRNEMWRFLELLFSFFDKDGKEIRLKLKHIRRSAV